MPTCSVDNIELPDHLMAKCDHCGQVLCLRHLKAHHKDVKMTFNTIPKLMGVRK